MNELEISKYINYYVKLGKTVEQAIAITFDKFNIHDLNTYDYFNKNYKNILKKEVVNDVM